MHPGIIGDITAEWEQLKVSRAFVVSDAGVVGAGIAATVCAGLQKAGTEVVGSFDDVPSNSEVAVVNAVVEQAQAAQADVVVAVGGGSVIDTAKLAACLLAHGGTVHDYAGAQTITSAILPLVVVPTTAGTGSEVSQAAVVYDAESQRKLSFVDEHLRPRLAVLDPELTVSLPDWLTAATGMDACVHAIEAFVGVQHSVFADSCAVQSLQLIREHLVNAIQDGSNIQARCGMMAAATLAGIAFDHSMVGVVHAMSHALGALTNLHHGHANAILLPLGYEYNREVCADRYALLARSCRISSSVDDVQASAEFAQWTRDMLEWCHEHADSEHTPGHDFPRTLHDAGVDRALIPQIASITAEDGASFYNPRPVEEEAIAELLTKHWGD